MNNIDLTNPEEIIEFLKECDDSYFNSDIELISDAEYDNLKKITLKLSPKDPYFVTTGSDVRSGKTKLPFAMNGLNQVYENEVEPWVIKNNASKNDIVITAKLDGVSVLLVFADKDGDGDAEFQIAYSRGNTVEGADITRHVKQLNFPKVIKGYSKFAVRAEIIQKDFTFRTKYASKFSSARALVSGKMNASITDASILADFDLIAYTIVDQSKKPLNKIDSLATLKQNGFEIPFTEVVKGSQLNDQFLISTIEHYKKTSAYELDGIVLTDNDSGESVKYKTVDKNSIKTTMFKSLEMDVSKWFTINPRISMLPVILNDTTVSFCTAWNLNFIYVNKVGPGSELTITKSGQTIPLLMEATASTITNYDQWFTDQLDNFVGKDEWKWNDTHVNVILKNPDKHPIVKFKQVLDFFESLKVDQLKENTLGKLFDHYGWNSSFISYEKIIETIFDLTEKEWESIIGKNGLKINESLHRRLGAMKLETLLGSLNYCGYGFGIRRAKQLLEQIDHSTLWNLTESDISALHGFNDKTAKRIAEGLPKVAQFYKNNSDYITILKEIKTAELKDVTVVFTGFRDDAFAAEIEQKGGKVSTGVSKKTTYLIASDPASSTGKPEKARSLGVKVVGIDEFKALFDL